MLLRRTVSWAAIAFAIALQIQMTITIGGSATRVGLADLLAILSAPLFFTLAYRARETVWLELRRPWAGLLCLAAVVMTYGLLLGILRMDGVQTWAAVKYIGWYSLVYYALMGALLAVSDPERVPKLFATGFVLFLSAVVIVHLPIASLGLDWSMAYYGRLKGLMGDPNAFGFVAVCGAVLAIAYGVKCGRPGKRIWWEVMAALACAGVFFSRSVAALLGLLFIVLLVWFFHRPVRSLLRVGVMSGFVYGLPRALNMALTACCPDLLSLKLSGFGIGDKLASLLSGGQGADGAIYGRSVGLRLELNARAFHLWQDNPVFGSGLGVFWQQQQALAADGRLPQIIHSTVLWLLTEFGIVGLAVFTALFVALALYFIKAMKLAQKQDPGRAQFLFAGLVILICWAVMSIAHELMYQRAPWFIMGLCAGLAIVQFRNSSAGPPRPKR